MIRAFVGESDNMTLPEVAALRRALGIESASELAQVADEKLLKTILENGFGMQRILSDLMQGGVDRPVPLHAIFLLLGQRYVVDSHVLSNVVYDRVRAKRMMPDPLDAAFAALGNDQAAALLTDALAQYNYAGNLASMRTLVDAHGSEFWSKNLYNAWLAALRALSPEAAKLNDPTAAGLPTVAATEAWGRRILSTQLASRAQLRHDTLLYAKPSYTSGAICEFPDAMVDPYPEFYASLLRFADHGLALADLLAGAPESHVAERVRAYFNGVREVLSRLHEMAQHQQSGTPFSAEHLEFINQAVAIKSEPSGCTTVSAASGWYAGLFYNRERAFEQDPTIADVHTQPTDEVGTDVGRVLHVGSGLPRLLVTTAETCDGPRAYVGVVSSYFERITDDWKRLTDSDWNDELNEQTPEEVRWMRDLVVR